MSTDSQLKTGIKLWVTYRNSFNIRKV